MKINRIKEIKGSVLGLVGLLFTVAIILFLAYKMLDRNFKKPIADKEVEKTAIEQGIDTSSSQALLDSTRQKLKDINQQYTDREKEPGVAK